MEIYPEIGVRVDIQKNWLVRYFIVIVASILIFFVPKMVFEYINVVGIEFKFSDKNPAEFASRWTYLLGMFSLFHIVGFYNIIFGWELRRHVLSRDLRLVVYSTEAAVVVIAMVLLIGVFGKQTDALVAMNMLGRGNIASGLDGYQVTVWGFSVFQVATWIHFSFTLGAVIYATTCITNYVVCTNFRRFSSNKKNIVGRVEWFKERYHRNLYGSTALLTAGVLQLAAWLGLSADRVIEKEIYGQLVLSILIYHSLLFTLVAFCSAVITAIWFNQAVKRSAMDQREKDRLSILIFDKAMIISVILPTTAGYLIKVVPMLFGGAG
jgi:hypothetical protein